MGVGITVEHLNAFYGKTQALFDINLSVRADHATALIGPSGCGKSTFIRCLNRMHETIPEARVDGRFTSGISAFITGPPPLSCGAAWAWCFKTESFSYYVDL